MQGWDIQILYPSSASLTDLLEPRNKSTMVYTRSEAVTILAATTKPGTTQRGEMIRAMIKKGWAPTTSIHQTLNPLLKDRREGKLIFDVPWSGSGHNGGGRRTILDKEDVSELVRQRKRGEAHGRNLITKAVKSFLTQRSGAQMGLPSVSPKRLARQPSLISGRQWPIITSFL